MSIATRMRRIMKDSCANIDFGLDEWDAHISAMVSPDPSHEASLLRAKAHVVETRFAWESVKNILLNFYQDNNSPCVQARKDGL